MLVKRRIALIGCSKEKSVTADGVKYPVPVREFYNSDLFRKRLQYCEACGLTWFVLSAKYGLIPRWNSVRYYDQTFADMHPNNIAAWAPGVVVQLMDQLCDDETPGDLTVEIHAGREYCEPLATMLGLVGVKVELPMKGLAIGKQLQFYSRFQQDLFAHESAHDPESVPAPDSDTTVRTAGRYVRKTY